MRASRSRASVRMASSIGGQYFYWSGVSCSAAFTRVICISVKVPNWVAGTPAEGACAWASVDAVTRSAVTPTAIIFNIANSGVFNFISWHRAEFRPARGRSISSSGETAAAGVGSDVRFVTKTAKPSARESAGGFAFVPPTCRMGRQRWASRIVFRRCGFFTAAKCTIRTPRFTVQLGRAQWCPRSPIPCRIGSAPRSAEGCDHSATTKPRPFRPQTQGVT